MHLCHRNWPVSPFFQHQACQRWSSHRRVHPPWHSPGWKSFEFEMISFFVLFLPQLAQTIAWFQPPQTPNKNCMKMLNQYQSFTFKALPAPSLSLIWMSDKAGLHLTKQGWGQNSKLHNWFAPWKSSRLPVQNTSGASQERQRSAQSHSSEK